MNELRKEEKAIFEKNHNKESNKEDEIMRYWGYRIDTKHRDFFFEEINNGRLRQGWGYRSSQNLTLPNADPSARRNYPIFNKVKKDDVLLIPHIEGWNDITMVRATEDFCKGYRFDIDPNRNDYGHIFPVEFIKVFSKQNQHVSGKIRETMKCRSRFWNMDRCAEDIEKNKSLKEPLTSESTYSERFLAKAVEAFDEDAFAENIYKELNRYTQASEWEHVLREGFRQIFPDVFTIETTANRNEKKHGADIIVKIPGILDSSYVIAIQVKDYEGVVSDDPIWQVGKADSYFGDDGNEKLVDKYVIITKASQEQNIALQRKAEEAGVKLIFDKDLKKLLSQMAKAFIGSTALQS